NGIQNRSQVAVTRENCTAFCRLFQNAGCGKISLAISPPEKSELAFTSGSLIKAHQSFARTPAVPLKTEVCIGSFS
ncbi:MAG: hypothetical protein V8Q27_02765, partial [Eubacteriales bacterium]